MCSGPIMAYLFRVDPDFAAQHLAQSRAARGCSLMDLQGSADQVMTPALEKQLIEDLATTPFPQSNGIADLWQNATSAAAKEALLAFMKKPISQPCRPAFRGIPASPVTR
jgi:hypothetical protein